MFESIMKDLEKVSAGKAFLSQEEVAEMLGCSKKVIYNWTKRKNPDERPPRVRIGKAIRFPKSAFIEWLIKEQGR